MRLATLSRFSLRPAFTRWDISWYMSDALYKVIYFIKSTGPRNPVDFLGLADFKGPEDFM
jgi:hypothetical protein